MKIEILFPEICNLYGDLANIRYLKECIPETEIVRTSLQTRPTFIDEPVDLVFMGTTTENGQILALEQLRFYREQIFARIEEGMNFLITGNAMELFGESIEEDGEEVCRGLGLFPGIARRSSVNRFNCLILADFDPKGPGVRENMTANTERSASEGQPPGASDGDLSGAAGDHAKAGAIQVVGYKSQFGHTFGHESAPGASDPALDDLALFTARRGPGMNRYAKGEGIRINNFFATYVIGPLLILNPPFTKWYIRNQLGISIEQLAFEEAAMEAYRSRVEEYSDPNTGLYYWGGTTERWT